MIVETRKYYCDACGKEIKGYRTGIDVIEIDEDGFAHSVGRDFCKECMISFQEWLEQRKKISKHYGDCNCCKRKRICDHVTDLGKTQQQECTDFEEK